VIYQSTLTGGLLAVGFVFLGRAIFRLLGLSGVLLRFLGRL
jgi:hypothetical protein